MKKILLHSCCGPCSTHCITVLDKEYEVTVYYYNPNILPDDEYYKRRDEQIRFINEYNSKNNRNILYVEGDYEPELFHILAKNRENECEGGQRCFDCIRMRLLKTADMAIRQGYDAFTTTLTVSPHKNAPRINEIGNEISIQKGIEWLSYDFKKKNGYLHSLEMSKEYNLYRQNYCGCGLGRFAKQ